MLLNMITTSVMIRLGRVKGNKMVNMQLSNQKLVDRGARMLVGELGLPYDRARTLLLLHGSVKKALDAFGREGGGQRADDRRINSRLNDLPTWNNSALKTLAQSARLR